MDFYEVLDVVPTAAPEEIRSAITQQRRVWIRRQASPDPQRRTEAEERVRQIDQAEKTLLDPQRRAVFDQQRPAGRGSDGARHGGGSAHTGTGTGSPTETDRQRSTTRPNGQPSAPAAAVAEWIDKARAYLEQGNAGAARRAAERACANEPTNPTAWELRGHASSAQGYTEDAEDEFAEALRLGADGTQLRRGLGLVHLRKQRWERAIADFQVVLGQIPADAVARAGVGSAYIHTRRIRQGRRMLKAVMKSPPAEPADRAAIAEALYEAAVASMAHLTDGSFLPLAGRQVSMAAQHARWIGQLQPADPEARTRADQLRQLAADARKAHWLPSRRKRWYLLALVVAFVPSVLRGDLYSGNLAWALCGVVVGVYVLRHRKPTWRLRRRELRNEIRSSGI